MGIIFSFWSVSSHLKTLLIYLSEEKSLLVMWSSPNSSKNVKTMGEITFAAKELQGHYPNQSPFCWRECRFP